MWARNLWLFCRSPGLFSGRYLKHARHMSTFERVDSVSRCTGIERDDRQFPREVMMDFLLYALFCLLLPIWIFSGLYLLVEAAEIFREHYLKTKK